MKTMGVSDSIQRVLGPSLVIALLMAASFACTPVTSILMPTSTPTFAPTPTPTATFTPTPTPPQIETSAGPMTIAAVELTGSFPPGCSSGPTCNHAKEGYQILIVWLERADGGSIREADDELFGDTLPHLTGSGGIHVADDQGSEFNLAITHVDDDNNRFALVFGVPETAQGFALTWLDDSPIELGK